MAQFLERNGIYVKKIRTDNLDGSCGQLGNSTAGKPASPASCSKSFDVTLSDEYSRPIRTFAAGRFMRAARILEDVVAAARAAQS